MDTKPALHVVHCVRVLKIIVI